MIFPKRNMPSGVDFCGIYESLEVGSGLSTLSLMDGAFDMQHCTSVMSFEWVK